MMAQKTNPSTASYWGEGGTYGPFDVQAEGEWAGWPHAGQVTRYFRKRAKLSARAFGELYGREVNEDQSPVSERWILEMELENKVPVDINKRKTIARLLKIPPILFGLATLEEVTLEPRPHLLQTQAQHVRIQKVSVDTTTYQNNVRTIWQLHDTGNAQQKLPLLTSDIQDLENFEQQTQGDLRYHVQETLLGYQMLSTHIVRDQRQFESAHAHANEAVRVAKNMNDSDLLATALFMRGWTYLEWGLFGVMKQGVFQVQQNKVSAAIRDFEAAKHVFPAQDGNEHMHPQLLGALSVYLSRAQAALATSRNEPIPPQLLIRLDDVAETVGRQNVDDLYMRALLTGTRKSWHQAGYLNTRATVFNTAGLPGQALKELNTLENLIAKTYKKDETRQFVWLDILKSNIYIGLGEFAMATMHARQALLASQDINSITNIAIITDIYGRLLRTSHKTSSDVKEIGDLLQASPILST